VRRRIYSHATGPGAFALARESKCLAIRRSCSTVIPQCFQPGGNVNCRPLASDSRKKEKGRLDFPPQKRSVDDERPDCRASHEKIWTNLPTRLTNGKRQSVSAPGPPSAGNQGELCTGLPLLIFSLMNANRAHRPGDQVGLMSSAGSVVRRRGGPGPNRLHNRCRKFFWSEPFHVNATWLPIRRKSEGLLFDPRIG